MTGAATAARPVALWTSSIALALSLLAVVAAATSPPGVCPPNYVQLIEIALAAVFALFVLVLALRSRPSVWLAAISCVLIGLAVAALVLAVVVHGGHLSSCWTF
jgi:hypothetical protein